MGWQLRVRLCMLLGLRVECGGGEGAEVATRHREVGYLKVRGDEWGEGLCHSQ